VGVEGGVGLRGRAWVQGVRVAGWWGFGGFCVCWAVWGREAWWGVGRFWGGSLGGVGWGVGGGGGSGVCGHGGVLGGLGAGALRGVGVGAVQSPSASHRGFRVESPLTTGRHCNVCGHLILLAVEGCFAALSSLAVGPPGVTSKKMWD